MKTRILILVIGFLFAFTTNAQRKLSRDKIQITKTKNAKLLGTDTRGNVFDNSQVLDTLASKNDLQNIDLSTKLEVGTYTGTASDLKAEIDNIDIPSYQAGTNITIDNTNPQYSIINATGSADLIDINKNHDNSNSSFKIQYKNSNKTISKGDVVEGYYTKDYLGNVQQRWYVHGLLKYKGVGNVNDKNSYHNIRETKLYLIESLQSGGDDGY